MLKKRPRIKHATFSQLLCIKMSIEKITKFEAAKRQLDTAITLWFSEADTVSIHTLVCSAHQIIHDINQQKGHRDLLYDSLVF